MKKRSRWIACVFVFMISVLLIVLGESMFNVPDSEGSAKEETATDFSLEASIMENEIKTMLQEDRTPEKQEDAIHYEVTKTIIEMDTSMKELVERIELQGENKVTYLAIKNCVETYFDESLIDYVMFLYRICEEDKEYVINNDYESSSYAIDIDKEVVFFEDRENYCKVGVTFGYKWGREYNEEIVPISLEKRETKWVITDIHYWCNDFRYTYMNNINFRPQSFSREQAKWLVEKFGTDSEGCVIDLSVNVDEYGYILADSSNRILEDSDVDGLTRYEQYLAIHEIYARHGKKFEDTVLDFYFDQQDWYVPYKINFRKEKLSKIEEENIRLLTQKGNFKEESMPDYGNLYPFSENESKGLSSEEAAIIIMNAFEKMDNLLVPKEENYLAQESQDVFQYYTLGKYSTKENLKNFLSEWFSEDAFEEVVMFYTTSNILYRDKEGNFGICLEAIPENGWWEVDSKEAMEIVYSDEDECRVIVPYVNHQVFFQESSKQNAGEILLCKERDAWIISEILLCEWN